jgi:hypothetical protein
MDDFVKVVGFLLFVGLLIVVGLSSAKESAKNAKWCEEKGLSHKWVRGLNTVCIDDEGNMRVPPG